MNKEQALQEQQFEIASMESPMRMMLLDAVFTDAPASVSATPPSVLLYGLSSGGESIAVQVNDFMPYFWFPAPVGNIDGKIVPLKEGCLETVKEYLNRKLQTSRKKSADSNDQFVAAIEMEHRTPLMYYRRGGPFSFLKVQVWRDKEIGLVAKELTALAEGNEMRGEGLVWKDHTSHEEKIKLGMRFFCDTGIAGGSWVEIKQAVTIPHDQYKTRCSVELVACWENLTGLTPDATHHMEFMESAYGVSSVPHNSEASGTQNSREILLDMYDQSDTSLPDEDDLPDFTQIKSKTSTWEPPAPIASSSNISSSLPSNSRKATWDLIAPLRIVALHVQCSGGGKMLLETKGSNNVSPVKSGKGNSRGRGRDRGRGRETGKSESLGSLSMLGSASSRIEPGFPGLEEASIADIEGLSNLVGGGSAIPSRDPVLVISHILHFQGHQDGTKQVVFTHSKGPQEGALPGVELRMFDSEIVMLRAWHKYWYLEVDPDIVCVYQMKKSLRYLAERFKVLKLGTFDLGRRMGQTTEVKSVVTYGKHWIKKQARMSSTSNQEVFRAYMEGRLVIDMLRVVLVSFNLSTFTLEECSQVFLGAPKEALSTAAVSELWQGKYGGLRRLLLYSLHEAEVVLKLMERLQTIPETVEMARVTGLTLSDVLYKAQMVRIQSLLLRSARKEGWLLGGTTLNGQLSESPFLLHPKDNHTAAFYQDPVAILDFASLYPSLFMAYNLCYTTLVHPEDAKSIPSHQLITSLTGAQFVVSSVRRGVLPRICGALITARKQARDRMTQEHISSEEYAVLDGRQKALKLCSNALYGFTGASASPQQAVPLADTCLSMGAASCKQAVQLVGSIFEKVEVIYAQTDSVFAHFKDVSIEEAIKLGTQAAEIVSQAFPSPIVLKFERVLCPFLLLQVNRYAGRQYTCSQGNEGQGTLFVKGIESERRDVPRFVRKICKQALIDVLVENDVPLAYVNCKNSIRRMVAGKSSLYDFIMTGGLWRVDDHDITKLVEKTKSSHKHVGASTAEEGRGPHVALSVRLKRKNPDRQFHIGERIPYVLMANSSKLQIWS
ncbi:DNA polymerase delta catalytic subunit isoform X5 [Physcomitrium patens]|uniref:DNA polymerase delta catalytic subunit n=2 Tax=Physcomitrium patens TaxID=3218 RepID=A0A7I4BAE9_PHYPA